MRRRAHQLITTGAVGVIAGALVLGSAAPAFADTGELWTPNVRWFDIESDEPYLEDAQMAYANLLGSGVVLPMGWTADAFDGLLYNWTVSNGVTTGGITWVAESESADSSGLSTWTYSGTTGFANASYEATLDIQGNMARWTIIPTGTELDLEIQADANFGSDGGETVIVVTPQLGGRLLR